MSRLILWLDSLTMKETFALAYGCIFALALLMAPIAWYIDKKTNGRDK